MNAGNSQEEIRHALEAWLAECEAELDAKLAASGLTRKDLRAELAEFKWTPEKAKQVREEWDKEHK